MALYSVCFDCKPNRIRVQQNWKISSLFSGEQGHRMRTFCSSWRMSSHYLFDNLEKKNWVNYLVSSSLARPPQRFAFLWFWWFPSRYLKLDMLHLLRLKLPGGTELSRALSESGLTQPPPPPKHHRRRMEKRGKNEWFELSNVSGFDSADRQTSAHRIDAWMLGSIALETTTALHGFGGQVSPRDQTINPPKRSRNVA